MFSHEKLKKRRMELNLTQSSIYQELGISRKTYSAWENGLAEPHAKNLRRLATCLKVQENYFVDETSALYTYPLLTAPHKKEVDQLASRLLERQRKISSLQPIRFYQLSWLQVSVTATMTMKQTTKLSTLIKISSTTLHPGSLGILWSPSIPMALLPL